ncbi:MAG: hypothetical protein ACKO2G_16190 [Verrucomicrobiales bacterium]
MSSASIPTTGKDQRSALGWIVGCLVTGLALIALYPDSYQQDGGFHFVYARWAWKHPDLFIGVWQRPLFSVFHAIPALGGYEVSRFWAAIISTAGAAMSWLTARKLGIAGSWRAIPFYLLQPALFLMWSDTMTEPLFAAVLSGALFAHYSGRRILGAVLASLCIGARPEGAFVALVWGLMMLGSPNIGKNIFTRGLWSLVLATGLISWVVAAWMISGDPLYIKNNWPPDWKADGAAYGRGPVWEYVVRFAEIAGPLLMIPVVIGLWYVVRTPGWRLIAALFLFTFAVHTLMRMIGAFGAAGYARYFSAFAPCLAIAGCVGWNHLADRLPKVFNGKVWVAVVVFSFLSNWWFVDGAAWNRDARAVYQMKDHFDAHYSGLTVNRFIYSQAAMNIAWDRDPWERPELPFGDKETSLQQLRDLPAGTLACWDEFTGIALKNISAEDLQTVGFQLLHKQEHVLHGWFPGYGLFGWGGPRQQTMYLLYKGEVK